MQDELIILHESASVGRILYDRARDRVVLNYDDTWKSSDQSFPISLSLPLEDQTYADETIRFFLQGLLPDNENVLKSWGRRFHVSPRNPFDLIKHVGEDCAGALQFVRPDRLDLILSGQLDSLTPLSEADLVQRIENLNAAARSIPVETRGRFSLAGAQKKDALHQKDGRWYVPAGKIPTTHILKPQLEDYEEHNLNEHFCLQLASQMGITKTQSEIIKIGKVSVISVKRYDRIDNGEGGYSRIHQEDTCQALGIDPSNKYQSQGGPSASAIANLLRAFSDDYYDDFARFFAALIFNWVVAGTDAHSKNYSILHAPGSVMRLAPLYDLASYLPYDTNPKATKLAMKIGGRSYLDEIGAHQWKKWAIEVGQSPEGLIAMARGIVQNLSNALAPTHKEVAKNHDGPFLQRLTELIDARARVCADLLA